MSTDLPLGKSMPVPEHYAPDVLVGIPRLAGRESLGLGPVLVDALPFSGVDVWNAYEFSWLDARGKPTVAALSLWVPADTPLIVESKSLKLYLGSFSGERHADPNEVRGLLETDLAAVVGGDLDPGRLVRLSLGDAPPPWVLGEPQGTCIDEAEVDIDGYHVDPSLLEGCVDSATPVDETLYSQLLKSNCPVTGQPDWATLAVHYRGGRIDRGALLRYLVSYRDHADFHEQCVERIFSDLLERCAPEALTVYARYTRRGGIDINPYRSNFEELSTNVRLWRQ
jgi:7-cyano-7-deazaguanine reductase